MAPEVCPSDGLLTPSTRCRMMLVMTVPGAAAADWFCFHRAQGSGSTTSFADIGAAIYGHYSFMEYLKSYL